MQDNNHINHTLRDIGHEAGKMVRKILGSRGMGLASLITEWENIVGPGLAGRTMPLKLSFPQGKRDGGTLSVRTPSAFAAELLHNEPQILSRINSHFGYGAIGRIKIVQGNPSREAAEPPEKPKRPLSEAERRKISERLEGIPDEGLRRALQELGEALMQKK